MSRVELLLGKINESEKKQVVTVGCFVSLSNQCYYLHSVNAASLQIGVVLRIPRPGHFRTTLVLPRSFDLLEF